jgi:RimJ/RimL family protein N-acetyltransferase
MKSPSRPKRDPPGRRAGALTVSRPEGVGPLRLEPVTLEGDVVRLEPLSLAHLDGLCAVGLDPEIWRWNTAPVADRDALRRWVETALAARDAGAALPFATIERRGGAVVGSTRFAGVDAGNRRVEIGWTWLAPRVWRTAVNTEAKLLMLRHAFDTWGCVRVELKTDSLNERSRAAIRRLGAVEEGTLRNHMITSTGRRRHSVYYSILDSEWPSVRDRLERRLVAAGE